MSAVAFEADNEPLTDKASGLRKDVIQDCAATLICDMLLEEETCL
jgi:hypothetical protein